MFARGPTARWWKWVRGRKYHRPSPNTFDSTPVSESATGYTTPSGLDSEGVDSLFPTCQAPSAWTWFRDRHLASAPDTIGISHREKQRGVLLRVKSSRDRRADGQFRDG
jgi:hypothetical protein